MYTVDTCPHLGCKDCKFYNLDCLPSDSRWKNCKRIGGTNLEFVKQFFASQPSGFHVPCNSFEPKHPEYADLKEWTGFDDFFPVYMEAWWSGRKRCGFTINGDRSIWYFVPLEKFVDGTMIQNGKLMATRKEYYKRTKDGFGYKLVSEEIDGVEL